MSANWANRQRRSNYLARTVAKYLFAQPNVNATQLYGLSKLSWITDSYEGNNASYIKSCKIPALENIFNKNYQPFSLEVISEDIAKILGDKHIIELIQQDTGFTNFYKAYRNSVLNWLESNIDVLLPMYKAAFNAKDDKDRKNLVREIAFLPGIPKANNPSQLMKPEYFLTPTFFMLDREIKFPLINGNKGVKSLLRALEVHGSDLVTQYDSMVSLYGKAGIKDAADLDQVGLDLPDFITTGKKEATKILLQDKNTSDGSELPLKDESDVEAIRKAGTIKQRRIHNQLTNKLKYALSNFTLLEGCNKSNMFDVLVKDCLEKNDLLIEVKSSIEIANIRMAVGQLFNYWFKLKGNLPPHLAILLPERPEDECLSFLEWMGVGLMWFEGNQLYTSDVWLEHLIIKVE